MNLEFVYFEDLIDPVKRPNFSFADSSLPVAKVMRLQCKGDIVANATKGPGYENSDYILRLLADAIKKAKDTNVDIFLTPEYSVPYEIVDGIVSNSSKQPNPGKIWCLCTTGIPITRFHEYIDKWKEHTHIIEKAIETYNGSQFINCLFYIFKLSDGKLCIVPQLKTKPMRDSKLECEAVGLSLGNVIYKFGKDKPNRLSSLICADGLNVIEVLSKLNQDENNNLFLLHPQLNESPRNPSFSNIRRLLYSDHKGNNIIYLSANWASDTTIKIEEQSTYNEIKNPWSCVLTKNLLKDWVNENRQLKMENYDKGLGYAYWGLGRANIWYSFKGENLQELYIKKSGQAGPSVSGTDYDVKVNRTLIPSLDRQEWVVSDNYFDDDLEMLLDCPEEYLYPARINIQDRDFFFGVCFGKDEASQLIAEDNEKCNRAGVHIDEESNEMRNILIENYLSLVALLQEKKLPSRLKQYNEGHYIDLEMSPLMNIFLNGRDKTDGALVCFMEKEKDAEKRIEHFRRELAQDILEKKLCIFTLRRSKVITYPIINTEIDATDRIDEMVHLTGGAI